MKLNYIVSVVCMLIAGEVMAQTPDGSNRPTATAVPVPGTYTNTSVNFVRTWNPSIPTTDTAVVIATARTTAEVKMTTSYVDGLGRQLQAVSKGISPLGRDLVSPVVYDSFGREHFKYLPYVQQSGNVSDGKFKTSPFTAQKAFYQDTVLNPGMNRESIYYAQTDFESSPFSRPLNVYSPGNSWAKEGGNHPTRNVYAVNDLSDSVRIWSMSGTTPVSSGIYPKAMLLKHTVIDEQNGQTVEFVDKEEHVILRKKLVGTASAAHAGWLCTYYVYDDLGALRVTLPPMAVQKGMTSAWNVSAVLDELCAQYQYDERRRPIVQKMPGKGPDYKVYDVRDRLVFSQSASQRLKSPQEWFMTNYDGQDRPVMTALYRSNSSRQTLQDNLTNSSTSQTISYSFPIAADLVLNSYDGSPAYKASNTVTIGPSFDTDAGAECVIEIDANGNNGTTVISPTNFLGSINPADITPLSYTYYDSYGYAGQLPYEAADFSKPQAGSNPYAETLPTAPSPHTRGLVTGTKVRVLGTDQWITTSFYFDQKSFEIQRVADNQMGGKDVLTTLYDFKKNVLSTYLRHRNPRSAATPQTTVLTMIAYDHAGRATAIKKRLNDDATQERTIVTNSYDEMGQLKDKRLNGTGTSQLDMLTYTYNIRGWLQGINKAYVNSSGTGNWFGEEINYDYGFTSKLYNGNIAGVKWKTGSNNIARAYGFSYDQADRLAKADFRQQNTTGAAWTADKADFSVSNLTYDFNGNIQGIKQMGLNGTAVSVVDQLTYKYRDGSNKLFSITDAVNVSAAKLGDFNDGTNTGNDYAYDTTGNVTSDLNKGITRIVYNHLSLPESIAMTSKGTISYLYDAAGNKLKKTVTDSTLSTPRTTETYYNGDFVYSQDTLQLFTHEEGRVRFLYDSAVPRYTYDYFEKDHLGNTRVVLGTSTTTKVYAATMETASAATENALFSNIDATRAELPAGYPGDGTTNTNKYVARLNAQNGKKVGPSLVLKVMAGDTVRIGVKAFYKSNGTNVAKSTAEEMLTALMQSLTGNAEAEGMHGQTSSRSGAASLLSANDVNNLKRKDPSQNLESKPKAYLNYILFDDQFKIVNENSGVRQVQNNPDEMSTLSVDGTVIKQSGFMYVYTSNESAENVYFDNLIVTQGVGPLLEETHYYPFGLTMRGISSKALDATVVENKYRFNGMEFENKEFSDGSGLEMYDTDFRQLDPQIGRWWQMDPKPQDNSSPYAAMANNPVLYNDPMGDTTWVFGTSGQFLGVVNDNLPNQVHFIDNSDPKTAPFDASKLSLEDANKLGQAIRDASVAFMGSKTAGDLKKITAEADGRKTELAFVGVVGPDKEVRLSALPADESNKVSKVDVIGQVDKKYPTAEEQSKIFIVGHVHDREAARPVLYPTTKENLDFLGEPSKSDYQPVLYRSPTATEKGRSVALIATHYGVTIYGTGASRSVYGPEDYVFAQKSHYLLYRNISGKTNPTTSLPHASLTIPKN